jgi:uncharacterized membrane protein
MKMNIWFWIALALYVLMIVKEVMYERLIQYLKKRRSIRSKLITLFFIFTMPITYIFIIIDELWNNKESKQ